MPELDALTRLETSLRDSIAAESFTEALPLLEAYAAEAGRRLRALQPGSADILALRSRVNGLLEWAELRTKAFRACAAAESTRLRSLTAYGPPPASTHLDTNA